MTFNNLLFSLTTFLFFTCQTAPKNEEQTIATVSQSTEIAAPIKYQSIKQKTFIIPLYTTGILRPSQFTRLHLKSNGIVEELPIKEGQLLQQGALIAQTNIQGLELQRQRHQIELKEALFKKKDLLVLHGGKAEIDSSVSPEKLNVILIQSGVHLAKQTIREIEHQISLTRVVAPFEGVVANLKLKQYQQGTIGQEICHFFNPNTFEVEFQLTEAEALRIKKGQNLQVIPQAIPEQSYSAQINVINPVVSKQGLVTLRARLQNTYRQRLFKGMNVRIRLEYQLHNQLVIPKEALVLRSGRSVVFTYDAKEHLAKWNYVVAGQENDKLLTITEGLKEGDLVIYEGHLNLNHDSKVVIKEN